MKRFWILLVALLALSLGIGACNNASGSDDVTTTDTIDMTDPVEPDDSNGDESTAEDPSKSETDADSEEANGSESAEDFGTTEPVSTEPESTEPESTEPETTKPESTEPETTKPESTEPETTKPESTKPESTEPVSTEPASTEPESTEPESTEPESTEPESTEPESTEPENTEPESTEPESTEPESTEPESTEPESTEPESTEPESTEPESTEPESTEPESTEPESTEPESTEPESTEPEEPIVDPEDALDTAGTYNILFIGNSYTYYNDMPTDIFANIAKAAGYENVTVTALTCGGHMLQEYARSDDEYGAQLETLLNENQYDYIILQEQSTLPVMSVAEFYQGARDVYKKIVDTQENAICILYSTWGRHSDHSFLNTANLTNETMTWKLAAAYRAIGEELGIDVAYVGLAFYEVYTGESEINLYHTDLTHPSYSGSYLAAMTLFSKIFGVDPTTVDYNGTLSSDDALILKTAALNAVYRTSEIPEEYRTSSEGVVPSEPLKADDSLSEQLTSFPTSDIITLGGGNGITGTSGVTASTENSDTGLSDAQKEAIADIRNGISIIGVEYMSGASDKYGSTSLGNLINGHWGKSFMAAMTFDEFLYTVDGTRSDEGTYRALITLNFGQRMTFDAIGFFSGNLYGLPGAVEVYVSDDGVNWTLVPSASWDAVSGTALTNIGKTAADPYNGNTAAASVLFSMDGTTGQYIRLGIVQGRYDSSAYYNTINTRELVVYGTSTLLLDSEPTSDRISTGITGTKGATAATVSSAVTLTDEQKADVADIGYGVSVIGASKTSKANAFANAVDNTWNSTNVSFTFDDSYYTVNGEVSESGAYRGLITLNFGKKMTFDALGFFSGNQYGFPGAADVYVSDDGVNWTLVPSASWNALKSPLSDDGAAVTAQDANGTVPGYAAFFNMEGTSGQYIRIAVITGRYDQDKYNNTINTREIVVYGSEYSAADASNGGTVPEVAALPAEDQEEITA